MHAEILTDKQTEILPLIHNFSRSFGLVGGTAIALHIGHRKSIDFDLFTHKKFRNIDLLKKLSKSKYKIQEVLVNKDEELTFFTNGVKITFFQFPYPIIFTKRFDDIIRVADLLTLSAMKAFAMGQRNKWKDYVDLYFILKDHYSLSEISQKATALFGKSFNEKIFRTQLAYFEDIDFSEEVFYLKGFETKKEAIEKALIEFSLS
jgi:hypothetical protein